jgi:hypothetical protein
LRAAPRVRTGGAARRTRQRAPAAAARAHDRTRRLPRGPAPATAKARKAKQEKARLARPFGSFHAVRCSRNGNECFGESCRKETVYGLGFRVVLWRPCGASDGHRMELQRSADGDHSECERTNGLSTRSCGPNGRNMQQATCCRLAAWHATCNRTTSNTQRATGNMLPPGSMACYMQPDNIEHATCNRQHAAAWQHGMLHATGQHRTRNVQQATYNSMQTHTHARAHTCTLACAHAPPYTHAHEVTMDTHALRTRTASCFSRSSCATSHARSCLKCASICGDRSARQCGARHAARRMKEARGQGQALAELHAVLPTSE